MSKDDVAPSLESIAQGINRKYGAGTIGVLSKMQALQIDRIPTGISKLDDALGGGFPRGRMVELYGQPSSGKSLISLVTIANAQKMGLKCVYIDVENSFDPVWAEKLGVDVDKLFVMQLEVAEDIIDTVGKMLEAEPGIIVVDSIAMMMSRAELEEEMDQQFMAPMARLLSRGLKVLTAKNKNTLILFVNQIRNTLTLYGSPTTTPGGNSLKHSASIRVEVKRDSVPLTASGKKLDPDIVGQIVDYKITKNKTAQPFKYGTFKFWYADARIEE